MKNFKYLVAKIVSYLFVPPSFTFLIFAFIGFFTIDDFITGLTVTLIGLILGLIIPVIFFLFLMRSGKVGDTDATVKEERNIPYSFGIFLSLTGYIAALFLDLPEIVGVQWIIYAITMISLLIINKYWKISAHSLGASVPLGLLCYVQGYSGLYFLAMVVIIGWSRILLKKHDIYQVVAGAALGFSISYFSLLVLI